MAKKITVSRFLKSARTKAGLSQKDVAERFGYKSAQFISNWERGLSHPPSRIIRELAGLYRISAEELYEVLVEDALRRVEREMRRDFESSRTGKA